MCTPSVRAYITQDSVDANFREQLKGLSGFKLQLNLEEMPMHIKLNFGTRCNTCRFVNKASNVVAHKKISITYWHDASLGQNNTVDIWTTLWRIYYW